MVEHQIVIQNGRVQFVYDDELSEVLTIGPAKVSRVSHVEPAEDGGWTADMSPIGGPILKNPDGQAFAFRSEALEAEREWLRSERGL